MRVARVVFAAAVCAVAVLLFAPTSGGGVAAGSLWICTVKVKNRVLLSWNDAEGRLIRTGRNAERMTYQRAPLTMQAPDWQLGPGGYRTKGWSIMMALGTDNLSIGTLRGTAVDLGQVVGFGTSEGEITDWLRTNGPAASHGGSLKVNRAGTRLRGSLGLTFSIVGGEPGDASPDLALVTSVLKIRGTRID